MKTAETMVTEKCVSPSGRGALVSGVAVRFVRDFEPDRGGPLGQLAADHIGDAHLENSGSGKGDQSGRTCQASSPR
jgi:hypothetical protein